MCLLHTTPRAVKEDQLVLLKVIRIVKRTLTLKAYKAPSFVVYNTVCHTDALMFNFASTNLTLSCIFIF